MKRFHRSMLVTTAATPEGLVGGALTPAVFLAELGRAVGRDLAAMGVPDLNGVLTPASAARRSSGADPGAAWAAAHLGFPPPATGDARGWD